MAATATDRLREENAALRELLDAVLEDRVVRIEELIAARWWQRPGVRRKLARELRASVAGYGDWMPRDFATRRVQYAGEVRIPQVTRARNAGSEDAL
jgi:hypothetical protein